jgi:hypothetical protein
MVVVMANSKKKPLTEMEAYELACAMNGIELEAANASNKRDIVVVMEDGKRYLVSRRLRVRELNQNFFARDTIKKAIPVKKNAGKLLVNITPSSKRAEPPKKQENI